MYELDGWTHINCKTRYKTLYIVIRVQSGPRVMFFIMAQLLVQILKKFGSGAKHSDFGVEV